MLWFWSAHEGGGVLGSRGYGYHHFSPASTRRPSVDLDVSDRKSSVVLCKRGSEKAFGFRKKALEKLSVCFNLQEEQDYLNESFLFSSHVK